MDDSGSNEINWGLLTINHRKRSDAGTRTDASSSASGARSTQHQGETGCSKQEG